MVCYVIMALPFLSASTGENGPEADHPVPDQVQDQPGPQAVRCLQPLRPLDDHSCLVVDPFDRPARLPGLEVVEDLLLPRLERPDEAVHLWEVLQDLQPQPGQQPQGLSPIPGRVKDLL